jgi:signal transduction histidine kinase
MLDERAYRGYVKRSAESLGDEKGEATPFHEPRTDRTIASAADVRHGWARLWPRLKVPVIIVLVAGELVLAYLLISIDSFTPINSDPSAQVRNGIDAGAIVGFVFTLVLGVCAGVLLIWRDRLPFVVSVALSILAGFTGLWVAASIGLINVIVHSRGWRLLVAVPFYAVAVGFGTFTPYGHALSHLLGLGRLPWFAVSLIFVAAAGAFCLMGFLARAITDLEKADRLRELRSEHERQLTIETARLNERNRIAHEMHDVLAHKISLLALHAGTLELQTDDEKILETARIIRSSAKAAMEDLRDMLTVLHADTSVTSTLSPQPTLDNVGELVKQSREAGVSVDFRYEVSGAPPPAHLGRTAYRIVQEALTNVHKHSPRSNATVVVSGIAGRDLHIKVANELASGALVAGKSSASGRGLPGLGERVAVVSGRLEYGIREGALWVVSADLPWPAASTSNAGNATQFMKVERDAETHA